MIKFGFELDVFKPRDKAAARDALGVPHDKFIIMSSASSLADPRKGLQHLADALQIADLPDVLVTCVGWFGPSEQVPIPGMRAMGYMKDPKQLANLYAAADVFVGPSLEEAFGQVFIEAVIMDVSIDRSTDLGLGYHGGTLFSTENTDDSLFYGGNNAQSLRRRWSGCV